MIPSPEGLEYMSFQVEGIKKLSEPGNRLLGDDMGLGKTVQVAGLINLKRPVTVLVICPASLKLNWVRELEKWLVQSYNISMTPAGNPDILVVNYDVLKRHHDYLVSRTWDLLVCDEAHYLKNPKAIRTKITLYHHGTRPGIITRARKTVFVTGTPIPNRVIEIWPMIRHLDKSFNNKMTFAKRYCAARKTGFGWDMSGSSHLDELNQRLQKVMIRRLKTDVLKDLPAKIRQIIELDCNVPEQDLFRHLEQVAGKIDIGSCLSDGQYQQVMKNLIPGSVIFREMSKKRKEEAEAKLPFVIQHLKMVMEEEPKAVVFCHHRFMIDQIAETFDAVKLYGGMVQNTRQEAVDRFQTDPKCRLFVGNFRSAGVGLTLTSARLVIFAEEDWVPSVISQAEDRAHRISQEKTVIVQHLVIQKTLDALMARTVIRKQEEIDLILEKVKKWDI